MVRLNIYVSVIALALGLAIVVVPAQAEVLVRADIESANSPTEALKQAIHNIHDYLFNGYKTRSLRAEPICIRGSYLLDYLSWIPGRSETVQTICAAPGNPTVLSSTEMLAGWLVDVPQKLILEKAKDLLDTGDAVIKVVKGESYVKLKYFLKDMMNRPLDFQLVAKPQMNNQCMVPSSIAKAECQKVQVVARLQLASDLVQTLEELNIEKESREKLRQEAQADYFLTMVPDTRGQWRFLLEDVRRGNVRLVETHLITQINSNFSHKYVATSLALPR